ncbi:MAG: M28 family peptidase [Acidobacteriaceae bacterium]
MPLRAATPLVVLLLASPALLCQSTPAASAQASPTQVAAASPHGATPSAGPAAPGNTPPASSVSSTAPAKESSSVSRVLFYYPAARETVEKEVHAVPSTDAARLDRLREAFRAAGCDRSQMKEEPVTAKHGAAGANLICTWPGDEGTGTVVIAAHYENGGKGQGAISGWSGAALLPFLYKAIQGQPRRHTYIFLETWKGEGATAWIKSLSRDEKHGIRAMIDVDALGLGVTRYFTTFSAFEDPVLGSSHLQIELLWAAIDDGLTQAPLETNPHRWLSVDDTDPFRALMIPTIVIHSVAPESDRLPGSAADIAAAVDGDAYFRSYHLMCTFLASLDRVATKLNQDDPAWNLGTNAVDRPDDGNPRVTFRQVGGWRTSH